MLTSDLIKLLQQIVAEEGDMPVVLGDGYGDRYVIEPDHIVVEPTTPPRLCITSDCADEPA